MKNPDGLCRCGCGRQTPLSKWSRRGYKRGEPLLYIKGHQARKLSPEYEVCEETGCWQWLRHSHWGYGRKWDGERVRGAHVLYWEQVNGPTPQGHELHHLCGNTLCVNPSHLTAVTRREHMAAEGRRPFGNPFAEVAA